MKVYLFKGCVRDELLGRIPVDIDYQLPITNYQLPITNYQLPITNYQLPITNYNDIVVVNIIRYPSTLINFINI
jgi:hypothetical protein